ncbi:MAG: hypothetical protein Q9160_008478 [Pyrenula sp. 1 TL-2023]
MIFLHTEYLSSADNINYVFASLVHRRVTFRRLYPDPDPNINVLELTLQEGILEDYVILNFCPEAATWQIGVPDFEARNHVLNVIIDSKGCCAEIYTHDWELLKQLFLDEGRQRYEAIKDISEDETEANVSSNGSELHHLKGEVAQVRQREEEAMRRERAQKMESDQEMAHLKMLIKDMQRNKDQKS